jgi:hypothetical protein
MKKIFAILICAFLICAMPVVAFAEEENSPVFDEEGSATENLPTENESATEGEISGEEDTPTAEEVTPPDTETDVPTPPKSEAQIEAELTTEKIVKYVQDHLEEISVIITMILTVFYQVRKHKVLNKSIGTLNNNSVTIAENSSTAVNNALAGVRGVSDVVLSYKDEIASLLAEVRQNAEEKKRLEAALNEVESYLKTSKLANVELANEVAELLVLANIPNSKKEELYSRHLAAVGAIADAEKTEVKEDEDVGQEV